MLLPLPAMSQRKSILELILQEEDLETDFSIEVLTQMTEGFLGLDIRILCGQAALACENTRHAGRVRSMERLRLRLNLGYLKEALRMTRPSVSGKLLHDIKHFEARYDQPLREVSIAPSACELNT